MTRRGTFLLWACLGLGAGFVGSVAAAPQLVMAVALDRLSDGGQRINRWHYAVRVTQDNQTVVRSSPDIAYAVCAFDLSEGPLLISQVPDLSGHYRSLGLYADNTDNFETFNDRTHPDGVTFVLALPGRQPKTELPVVLAPSPRGLVLDRRIAPTREVFDAIDPVRRGNLCRLWNGD